MASIERDVRRWMAPREASYAPRIGSQRRLRASSVQLRVKRLLDVGGAAALMLLLLPLFAVVALAVRLSSRGPLIFRQPRIGQGGREFPMYKFRTMRADAAEAQEDMARAAPERIFLKFENDPRVTRVGAVLRRYSLDELPQLLNVLRGDMSLIGPRPLLTCDYERFPRNGWMRRFAMKPGMTGLWQVSGRSLCSEAERMQLDLQYVDDWSLRTDLRIALRTPGAVLSAKGAY